MEQRHGEQKRKRGERYHLNQGMKDTGMKKSWKNDVEGCQNGTKTGDCEGQLIGN